MEIECTKYVPTQKGCLIGYADLHMKEWNVRFLGVTLFQQGTKKWVGLPSKEYVNDEGVLKFSPTIKFEANREYDEFCRSAKKAIEKFQEGAFRKTEEEFFRDIETFTS